MKSEILRAEHSAGIALPPSRMADDVVADAHKKDGIGASDLLTRSFLCTPFLAYATVLCALLVSQGWPTAAAGLLFPVGYVMLAILGLEMVTGSFSVLPIGLLGGMIRPSRVLRNWVLTFGGNLVGGIFFAALLWFALTRGGAVPAPPVLEVLNHMAEKKISYQNNGLVGWIAAIAMGILCNWLVSVAPILAKASTGIPGKVLLMWLPIATFFAIGFEHSVVNMFIFPLAILSGAKVTFGQWWFWNQIPVTIGNIVGAVLFNALLWFRTYHHPVEK